MIKFISVTSLSKGVIMNRLLYGFSAFLLAVCFVSGCGGGNSTSAVINPIWGTKQLGVSGADTSSFDIALDGADNIFVAGTTTGGLAGNTLTGTRDAFLAKYHSNGARQWVRQLGGTAANTSAESVAVDINGNIVIVGSTTGGLSVPLTGTEDMFIAMYDTTGSLQWVRQLGVVAKLSVARGVAIDSLGNIFVAGYTSGSLDGNAISGMRDLFLVKYDATGIKLWSKLLGVAAGYTMALNMAIDASDNVYVTGQASVGLDGNAKVGTEDVFITKYNNAGTKQWTKQLGVAFASTMAQSIVADFVGNIFVVGETSGGLDGNSLTGSVDFFLVKYNSAGVKQWTKQLGVTGGITRAYSVIADSSGNIFISGYTTGGLGGNIAIGFQDYFVTKLDATGAVQWTEQVGEALKTMSGEGLAISTSEKLFVAGYTSAGLDGNTVTGLQDSFVARYNLDSTR